MHLLAAEAGRIDDGDAAVDLDQLPGDIVFLSSADSELSALGQAASQSSLDISLRLANLGMLSHPLSVDLYIEKTLSRSKLIVVRMMGGEGYWPYGLDRLREAARNGGPILVVVPGEDRWDLGLEPFTTSELESARGLWRYLVEGGAVNSARAFQSMAHLLGRAKQPPPPEVLPRAGCYLPGDGPVDLARMMESIDPNLPSAAIVFYRAYVQSAMTAPIDALAEELAKVGINAVPIFVASLKDRDSEALLNDVFAALPPAIVLNTTAFAVSTIGTAHGGTVLDRPGRPVLQVVLAGTSEENWRESVRGLPPRDLTMNAVLPEVDGRIFTRAVSFKAETVDRLTGNSVTEHRPLTDRVRFVVSQASAWVALARKPVVDRRVAIVLSNYPNHDGRLANGVGLDTPASAVVLAEAMQGAGYRLSKFPATSASLMAQLLSGTTNAVSSPSSIKLSLATYRVFFDRLPASVRDELTERWGAPEDDPFFIDGAFNLAVHRFENVVIGIQPSRGYNIDPKSSYHDPDLVPPHHYLAFYAWHRLEFAADAIIHLGKHGNLEWLPGKALGLSQSCWPEVAFGPVPLIYPFIVNDPGEGAQAKRRASAVIVDHLMPAMTRAEIHGGLAELETLIDEYYLAAGVDMRRRAYLQSEIIATAELHGLDRDLGIDRGESGEALQALDAHLCELKEMQIRDGLHILGQVPIDRQRVDTLAAIARVPRSGGEVADASLHRALAADLGLAGFDPLDCDFAAAWSGARPLELLALSDAAWRSNGDTVERIELLAAALVKSPTAPATTRQWPRAQPVLDWIAGELLPALDQSGGNEVASVLDALDGRFVEPGPSGAPTRGRPDVLPTGRNFYSVDVRAVPTQAAWALGRQSADALALRYFQDEGEWPRSIAISAWGTSNMRTGGDDIAQVLALIGAKPVWESGTGRVTGFTILTLGELGRPRIDVTLRISGMFRDAFPAQIDLVDSAIRGVAELDEPDNANPIAAAAKAAEHRLAATGLDPALAKRQAGVRIFGAKPGAYGAGLQAMIDEGIWETRGDLADAFLAWGGFAYGAGADGEAARDHLAALLSDVDAVFQAQDNREHDILDSDDYYQFQGGLAATVETLKGAPPIVYHGDHSRPEKPVVRTLSQEIARVVRGRAANPKWIAGVMRHGYKGAFEMAATVDYLFAYAATTNAVGSHHFDQLYDAYIGDNLVRDFIADNNPPALCEMSARLREAIDRGLWAPRTNSAYDRLTELIGARHREAAQ